MKIKFQSIFMILGLVLLGFGVESGIITDRAGAQYGYGTVRRTSRRTARRTSRRVITRSTIYVRSLPPNCTIVTIEGVRLHQCGATYYQPYQNQYVVVYVN